MVFHGIPLSAGIARGKAFLLKKIDIQQFRKNKRRVDLVSSEIAKLDLAISKSKDQIAHLMSNSRQGAEDQSNQIFKAELCLLDDPEFVVLIKKTIESTALHGEAVLAEEIALLQDKTMECKDELTVKGLITMQDLYYRLLYNMLPSGDGRISSIIKIPAGSILVADRLTPVEVAVMPMGNVSGILIEEKTIYSHASIMLRTLGVPIIINFHGVGPLLDESTDIMIDGYRGYAFLNPSEATIKECYEFENSQKASVKLVAHSIDESTVHTADGLEINILSNASNLADVLLAHSQGITKIGLFRSEMRYLASTVLPSDKQETAYYTGIFGVEGIKSMTVRLLDMGGDKLPVYLQMTEETDPQLGCRGIRFLLSRPDLMKKQISAILTARGAFNVSLLLPFITTVDDLSKARKIIEEVFTEMKISGDFPQIGIMIEVPSVALSIEKFLPKVDFVCLGTNDLIQFIFAVNRDQDELQQYNRFIHPVFLEIVKKVILTCKNNGKPLTICGEMASDPTGSRLLVAMGATKLSVQPDALQRVSHAVSNLNTAALQKILPELFDLESSDKVEQKLSTLGSLPTV
jgi:phosphotransferase system enzyme I (PtsI)